MLRLSRGVRASKLPPATFFGQLSAVSPGAGFFGVPDSLLKDFCAYLTENVSEKRHVIAANEGNAVALGTGHYLATGAIPVVYLQNSGVGNTLNPLLSLTHKEVYQIPILLIIGWRGDPTGKKDEPQHVAQGRLMPECLKAAEVPFSVIEPCDDIEACALEACQKASEHFHVNGTPYAMLVKRDTFETFKLATETTTDPQLMSRECAIETILGALHKDDIVVGTTGMPSREIFEVRARTGADHSRDFLTVGAMGHANSIAAGIALGIETRGETDRNIVCLDGDGALLMHTGSLPVVGGTAKRIGAFKNLKHIVVNNSAHDSVGGQPTVGSEVSLTDIATASGYNTLGLGPVKSENDLKDAIKHLLASDGPAFLEVLIKKGNRKDLGRPTISPVANKRNFIKHVQKRTSDS